MGQDQKIRFKIGDAFSDADAGGVKLLRLLIATRAVTVAFRSNLALEDLEPDRHKQEDGVFCLLASVGASHEAAKAFRSADSAGCFRVIEGSSLESHLDSAALSDLRERLERLRSESNPDDENSLASRRHCQLNVCRARFGPNRRPISESFRHTSPQTKRGRSALAVSGGWLAAVDAVRPGTDSG